MVDGRALGQGDDAGGDDAAAHINLNELWAEVGLTCLEQLLAQDDIALADADQITVKEGDVLGLIPFCDQGEEVEVGADPAATGTDDLLAGDLNGSKV